MLLGTARVALPAIRDRLGECGVSGCGGRSEPTRSQLLGAFLAGAAAGACQCQTDEAAERAQEGQVGVSIGGAGLWTREQQRRDRPLAVPDSLGSRVDGSRLEASQALAARS